MGRRMLQLTILDQWSSKRVRALMKLADWAKEATKKRLLWAEKMRSMIDDEWDRLTTTWISYEYVKKRKRGHPCTRWRDELSKKIGQHRWSITKEEFDQAMIRHSN
ncbi:hypothetical protein Y032_0135g1895 [Ancylostoma ceylanicum]|uniref:Uncharacterized protein n=1 Tax=Ancylostoma ceylanicum TaxID=53326 RepID=A0A016T5G9_9BILA|nr:hypothetical protein Y032_0135g1895 [Ancylostoma ceylanicum]